MLSDDQSHDRESRWAMGQLPHSSGVAVAVQGRLIMTIELHNLSFVLRALKESNLYTASKPRTIPPSDSDTRPALKFLFEYAVWVRAKRARAKRFNHEGVQYAIVWVGRRMCVMHVQTARVLVGAPGVRHA